MPCPRSGARPWRHRSRSLGWAPRKKSRRSSHSCVPSPPASSPGPWCRWTAASVWGIDADSGRLSGGQDGPSADVGPRAGSIAVFRRNTRESKGAPLMERDDALAALREVAVEVLSVDPEAVQYDARFKEDLDADSLDLVELVMGLEERFDISVPEEDLEDVATVGQAVDLVLAKVAAKA